MLHKNKRNGLAVLVAFATAVLLLACNPPSAEPPLDTRKGVEPPPVCGQKAGQALGTEAGGGINDADKTNAVGACLKIRQIVDPNDNKTKWFTSSPSKEVVVALAYSRNKTATNSGDTYHSVTAEKNIYGPSGGFVRFSQDGKDANPATGENSQYDRWCKKLAALSFAGQANWRRTTMAELVALYEFENTNSLPTGESMYARFGWPSGLQYWSSTQTGTTFPMRVLSLYNNLAAEINLHEPLYASCVAERP